MAATTDALPDLLRPGLDVVFVGTAAGRRSAAVSAYYAHPENRFWRTLAAVGLTPRLYDPNEFRDLSELGIGFTDMSKSASGMDIQIPAHTFDRMSFERKIGEHRPRLVAFTSKKAASVWFEQPTHEVAIRLQPKNSEFPDVFVLPSPSGAASRYWDEAPWRALADRIERA